MKLEKEDYLDFSCSSCSNDNINRIPIKRIIEKVDSYYDKNDQNKAIQLLLYWEKEARSINDNDGLLSLCNELMGYYRKNENEEKSFFYVNEALGVLKKEKIEDSIMAGTTYLNIATVNKVFNNIENSLHFYNKALNIYEKLLDKNDTRLGGLYNNMALAYVDNNEFVKAKTYYNKALEIMKKDSNSRLEVAITYANLADAIEKEKGIIEGEDEINNYLEKVKQIIEDSHLERNGYYAYVISCLAPQFSYYGYFLYANELKERSKEIYERS